ncbi:MAG TPA: class I SAM-dependent methyltransferase [Anaerolineales bacterium]|nr:class I SAM-dependent methyltransferase [Anaerolineales bacterium]
MAEKTNPKICDYEGSSYQSEFWETGGRAYEDLAEAIALRRLLPGSGRLLLEAGAGAGRNTPRYKGYDRVVLLDYSVTQLQQAQERLGRSERYVYVAGDVYNLPFVTGLFDAATMIRVIHHLAEPENALAEIERTLGSGGAFILEYANKLNLKAIARYLLRLQDWSPFTPEPVEFVELNFNFHPRTMRRWLETTGFDLRRQLTVSHFRIGILKKIIPARWLAAADSLASLTGDWWQVTPSVFTLSLAKRTKAQIPGGTFFRCPACSGSDFDRTAQGLACRTCGAGWPVEDGIYIFK